MLTCLPIKTGPAPPWPGAGPGVPPDGAPCITQLLFCCMLLKRRHYYYSVIIFFSLQILLGASKFGSFGVNCTIFRAPGRFFLRASRQVANWHRRFGIKSPWETALIAERFAPFSFQFDSNSDYSMIYGYYNFIGNSVKLLLET